MIQVVIASEIPDSPIESGAARMRPPGRIQPDNPAVIIHHLKPATDVHGCRRDDFPGLDNRELRRAAPDIDIENAFAGFARHAGGTGTISREHRFHMMTGGRADKIAACFGQHA